MMEGKKLIRVRPDELRVGDVVVMDQDLGHSNQYEIADQPTKFRKVTEPVWTTCYLTQVIPTDRGLVVVKTGGILMVVPCDHRSYTPTTCQVTGADIDVCDDCGDVS